MNKNLVKRLRLSEAEAEAIDLKMQELGISNFSEFALLKMLDKRHYNKSLKRELIYELHKIGNNLNQIAKELNTNKDGIINKIALATLSEIQELTQKIYSELSTAREHE